MSDEFRQRRILALSDYGTTGISESLRPILKHWFDQGHIISQLALGYNGWGAGVDRTMYPWYERLLPVYGTGSNADRFGQKLLHKAVAAQNADIVITAFDAWMIAYLAQPEHPKNGLTPDVIEALAHETRKFTHISYFPLDGAVNNKYLPGGMEEVICGFDSPVTYSRYAQQIIENDVNIKIPFIPIAHDPKHYHPGNKIEARKKIGLPEDDFIVAMVATNQYRKAWGEFFDAVLPFAKRHPNVSIIPWTAWNEKIAGGAEIADFVWRSGVRGQILDPSTMIGTLNDEGMGDFYRSLDVLVLTTIGEGAGLPPIRARACGVPALVTDNTSNTEFAADPFELIPTSGSYYDPFGSNLERYTTDVLELTVRLERLYEEAYLRKRLGKAGAKAMRQYEVDNVMPMWDELLAGIA